MQAHNDQFTVTQDWLQSVWRQGRLPTPREQGDALIEFLGTGEIAPGQWRECDPREIAGLIGTVDNPQTRETTGFSYVVNGLKARGLVEQANYSNSNGTINYRLTLEGWERFDDLLRRTVDSRVAFMAMGYSDERIARAAEMFVSGVAQTGFELRRLDQKPKAGLIDLRMRVEIRSAKFLIADLTDENRGAYWEAGFAEGLGKKVYYTCEATKFETAKTHFDTEHLLTIKWTFDSMANALDELKSAIRNDFPTDATQLDAP